METLASHCRWVWEVPYTVIRNWGGSALEIKISFSSTLPLSWNIYVYKCLFFSLFVYLLYPSLFPELRVTGYFFLVPFKSTFFFYKCGGERQTSCMSVMVKMTWKVWATKKVEAYLRLFVLHSVHAMLSNWKLCYANNETELWAVLYNEMFTWGTVSLGGCL